VLAGKSANRYSGNNDDRVDDDEARQEAAAAAQPVFNSILSFPAASRFN